MLSFVTAQILCAKILWVSLAGEKWLYNPWAEAGSVKDKVARQVPRPSLWMFSEKEKKWGWVETACVTLEGQLRGGASRETIIWSLLSWFSCVETNKRGLQDNTSTSNWGAPPMCVLEVDQVWHGLCGASSPDFCLLLSRILQMKCLGHRRFLRTWVETVACCMISRWLVNCMWADGWGDPGLSGSGWGGFYTLWRSQQWEGMVKRTEYLLQAHQR